MTPDPEGPARLDVNTEAGVVPVEERPPTTRRLATWWFVVALVVVGLLVIALDQLRYGVMVLAGALWVAAGLRAALPSERAGGLVVRSRVFDVVVLLALGLGILVIGLALRSR